MRPYRRVPSQETIVSNNRRNIILLIIKSTSGRMAAKKVFGVKWKNHLYVGHYINR